MMMIRFIFEEPMVRNNIEMKTTLFVRFLDNPTHCDGSKKLMITKKNLIHHSIIIHPTSDII